MDKTIIAAFVGVAGALVCVYIGYLLSSLTAKKTVRLHEFNKAAGEFHSEFLLTICNIRQHANHAQFLKADAIRHGIAMMKFRPYLSGGKTESFDAAWRKYACPHKDKPDYIDMSPYETQGVEEIKRMRNLAIKRIERLLKFAEPI